MAVACMGWAWTGSAAAEGANVSLRYVRVADAASDACLSRCDRDSAACKSICPSTVGTACLTSCDSQHQMCRQGCQNR